MLSAKVEKEVRKYLKGASPEDRVYIGCDSRRFKRGKQGEWWASYDTAIVIHKNNKNGCKVIVDTELARDYDQKRDRPQMRMMNECYKAVEAYQQLEDILEDREVEVHLDLNEDERHGSSCAKSAAVGYAKGVTGRTVRIKPYAFAASYAADRQIRI